MYTWKAIYRFQLTHLDVCIQMHDWPSKIIQFWNIKELFIITGKIFRMINSQVCTLL